MNKRSDTVTGKRPRLLVSASALVLGGVFVGYAWRLWRSYSDALAKRTFGYSIWYLAALFGAMLLDHWL
jgi:protoheme IX farnesyltransferase